MNRQDMIIKGRWNSQLFPHRGFYVRPDDAIEILTLSAFGASREVLAEEFRLPPERIDFCVERPEMHWLSGPVDN